MITQVVAVAQAKGIEEKKKQLQKCQ